MWLEINMELFWEQLPKRQGVQVKAILIPFVQRVELCGILRTPTSVNKNLHERLSPKCASLLSTQDNIVARSGSDCSWKDPPVVRRQTENTVFPAIFLHPVGFSLFVFVHSDLQKGTEDFLFSCKNCSRPSLNLIFFLLSRVYAGKSL